jgi:ligand-binding sensor domain-containing protein
LAGNTVLNVYEDSSNRIWVCTTHGASVIIGGTITNSYTSGNGLSGQVVYCVNQISSNAIYVGTNNGVTVFSNTLSITDTINNLYGPEITAIMYSNGTSYYGHENNGVTVIENGNMTNYSNWDGLVGNTIYSIGETSDGNIWFANNSGITKYDGMQWNCFNQTDGMPFYSARSIAIDSLDNIWLTASSNSLFSFNQETCVQFPLAIVPSGGHITKVQYDKFNRLWAIFSYGGAAYFENGIWTSFTTNAPFSNYSVNDIFVENSSEIWFATSHGISHYLGGVWTSYNSNNGFANSITDVIMDENGLIWATCNGYSDGGLYTFNGTDWNRNIVNTNNVQFVYIDSEGSIWCGGSTNYGNSNHLTQYKNGNWYYQQIDNSLTNLSIYSFYEDSHKNLWVGTNKGVYTANLTIVDAPTESSEFNGLSIYPNPSNDLFTIETNIKEPGFLNISLYNLQGQLVLEENISNVPAGPFSKNFSTSGICQGVYSCVVRTDSEVSKTKLIILK